ncbi:DUF2142 domain-containing protein [Curtobacterium sp. 9128]|uniref:DUF2142 domain-containing protein n=1 Tax=Curtobacterium sp. 9128 TaxID=1793722 RepID=UPI0011A47896|nr:DUF2142 domain-containing protein [Curtobacterium sp. 9128]
MLTRPVITTLVAWASIFLVLAAWALASPIGSGPDESNHFAKAAATVRGQWTGTPTDAQGVTTVRVPQSVADPQGAVPCFARDADRPATCAPPFSDSAATVTVPTGVGDYYPAYYLLVGWPTLVLDGAHGYLAVRLVSALLVALLLAVVVGVGAALRRPTALPAWAAVAITPMTVYLGGLVTPSAVEIAGCAALAAVTWLVLHDGAGRRLRWWLVLLVATGVLAGSMRTSSPLMVVLVVLGVLLTDAPRAVRLLRERSVLVALAAAVVLLVPAAVWAVAIAGPAGYIPSTPERYGFIAGALRTLELTPDYAEQMIGILGWFDLPLPAGVLIGWTMGIGFVLLAALSARRRAVPGVVLLVLATVLVPVVLQGIGAGEYGIIWQGRYGLPLLVPMVLVAGLVAERSALRHRTLPTLTVLVPVLATIGQAVVFVVALHRYTVGRSASWGSMFTESAWHPAGGTGLALVLAGVGLVGTVVLAAVVPARARGPRRRRDVDARTTVAFDR